MYGSIAHNVLQLNEVADFTSKINLKNKIMNTDKSLLEAQSKPSFLGAVMCRFLFQYRSMDKDLMVHIEASSLNDAMVKFATHYHLIDEVYEIARVS